MPIKTPKWRNMVILILCFTMLVVVFEVFPGILNNADLVFEWIEQSSQIDKSDEIENRLTGVKQQNSQLKSYINNIVSNYEEAQNSSSILKMLDEIATRSKVDIEIIKPKTIIQRDNLWLQPIDIVLTSQYENYYNFIRFLENSQKVVLVKEIFIESGNSDGVELQISLKLEVYLNL